MDIDVKLFCMLLELDNINAVMDIYYDYVDFETDIDTYITKSRTVFWNFWKDNF